MWHQGALFMSQSKCQRTYVNTNQARSALDPLQWLFVISTIKDCLCSKADTGTYKYQQAYLAKCHVCAWLYYPIHFSACLCISNCWFPWRFTQGQRGYKDLTGPWISFICMSLKSEWHFVPLSWRVIDVVLQERKQRRCNLHPHAGLEGAAESVQGSDEYFILA